MVNGATGTCISSLAPRARRQPSGVVTMAGSAEGTCASAGGAAGRRGGVGVGISA